MDFYKNKKRLNRNNQKLAAKNREGEYVAKHLKQFRGSISQGETAAKYEGLNGRKHLIEGHGLSVDEFSTYLADKGVNIGPATLRHYESGDRLITLKDAIALVNVMGISLDEFLLGIPSTQVSAQSLIGLPNEAINNLVQIKKEHVPGKQHLFPLLGVLLSDKDFLDMLQGKICRLVYHRAREQADHFDDDACDTDLSDGIEYAISREFVSCIRKYVTHAVDTEAKKMEREDLEYTFTRLISSSASSTVSPSAVCMAC